MMERTYAMTRVRRGDYLLPANDLSCMWRLVAVEEDGSAYSIETLADGSRREHHFVGTFWTVFRSERGCDADLLRDPNLLESPWSHWNDGMRANPIWCEQTSMIRTRREAIDYVLSADKIASR